MKMKKFFSVITMLAVLLSLSTTAFADNVSQIISNGNTVVFIDVPNNHWAKAQIDYFAQKGIIAGYKDGSFRPGANVTREEFCKLLVSTFNQKLETPSTPTFSDVAESKWSYPYVEACSDFLTGYANPFGGRPAFHPTEYATREDIAVALVRMMGYTDNDANDAYYAERKFLDGSSISPSLLPYVSIACEKGLISGYPNGTFGPAKGITRAETVALLNRATKQAVTNINEDLNMSTELLYGDDQETVTINICADAGTTVTVNGEAVKMSNNYGGYEGNYVYEFETEGTKDFTIEGKRAGKTKTINLTAKYEIGAPVLKITECPATSDTETVTIRGTVKDTNDSSPVVTVNGKSVNVDYRYSSGGWRYETTLKEGNNDFTIVATNSLGKATTVKKTINFGVGAPTLKITECPATSNAETVTISGTVSDTNDSSPTVTVNGSKVNVGSVYYSSGKWSGKWSYKATLKEGNNDFTIVATNSLGKATTVKKTINFGVGAPTLKITECPATSNAETVTISGTVSDTNDSSPTVTVNGSKVNVGSVYYSSGKWSGKWSYKATLKEGDNDFTIIATNSLGKTTTEKRTINFGVGAPTLKITECPATSNAETVTISGTVSDTNDASPTVTVNGSKVNVDYGYYTSGRWSYKATLKEGDNDFTIIATNSLGKTTTEKRTINFGVGAPTLKITECPAISDTETVTISGTVSDTNDDSPTVTVNGSKVNVGYGYYTSGRWSYEATLKEGDNDFTIIAANNFGKTTTEKRTIHFEVETSDVDVVE